MNFWGYIINGVISIFNALFWGMIPDHKAIGLVQAIWDNANSTISLLFVVVFSNFNLLFPLIALGVVSGFEMIQFISDSIKKITRFVG